MIDARVPPIIDCDVHPSVPDMRALLPYLEPHWQDTLIEREVDPVSQSYPPNSPLTARPDLKGKNGRAGLSAHETAGVVFDRWGANHAILNCLYGVQLVNNEDMAFAIARAVNEWIAREWLDRDARFSASIVISLLNVERAVAEIERCAADPRFVQILTLAMGETPLGKRHLWPIYAAAERLELPIGIHAGSAYRHPVTSLGWPSYYIEDYSAQSLGFQGQVASLITEGVFQTFPALKVVLIESGVTWLAPFLWRLGKFWRGVRMEVPWVDRPPAEIMRDNIRLTAQPLDGPADPTVLQRALEHLGSDDLLLYASDYPHWQFDGDRPMPPAIPEPLRAKLTSANPLETYPRLAARITSATTNKA